MSKGVLVVEDDDLTRITLTSSLRASGVTDVFATSTIGDAIELANIHFPSVALLDLHLGPGPTGLDLARQLRFLNPHIGIVILTSYDDPRLIGENPDFIPSGTHYLRKKDISDISVITDAIAQTHGNIKTSNSVPTNTQSLSDNQLSILKLVAEGHSNGEIAKRRGVSTKAVEATLKRIAEKLGLEQDSSSNQRIHIARVYFRALGLNLGDES